MIEVELLYFDGCPSWDRAWAELGNALVHLEPDACVRLRNIEGFSAVDLRGFRGSPTLRINGHDLEDYEGPAVIACRRYLGNGGHGWPSQALLRERLRAAAGMPARQRTVQQKEPRR